MWLALVLSVQATTAAAAAPNPCADQMSMLCKISPLFCPTAYPSELTPGSGDVPCWPGATSAISRDTRVLGRPGTAVQPEKGAVKSAAAPRPSPADSSSAQRQDSRARDFASRFARVLGLR
jgi:hypothetical protein